MSAAKKMTNAEVRARIMSRLEARLKKAFPDDAPPRGCFPRTRFASFDDLEAAAVRTGDGLMQDIVEAELARALLMEPEELPEKCETCGRRLQHSVKPRTIKTIRGPTTFELDHVYCRKCRKGFFPRGNDLPHPAEEE